MAPKPGPYFTKADIDAAREDERRKADEKVQKWKERAENAEQDAKEWRDKAAHWKKECHRTHDEIMSLKMMLVRSETARNLLVQTMKRRQFSSFGKSALVEAIKEKFPRDENLQRKETLGSMADYIAKNYPDHEVESRFGFSRQMFKDAVDVYWALSQEGNEEAHPELTDNDVDYFATSLSSS